jgi:hypothetical protein
VQVYANTCNFNIHIVRLSHLHLGNHIMVTLKILQIILSAIDLLNYVNTAYTFWFYKSIFSALSITQFTQPSLL